jgi:NAD-dependent SIR2 family protein deacetylase
MLKKFIDEADNVIVLAGAGLSADLGIPTYWTGDDAQYGSTTSVYGHTALEHSKAQLWMEEPESQVAYFMDKFAKMESVDFAGSSYELLKQKLATKNSFFITSNVDSAFLNIGFDENRILEYHGSYRNSQCVLDPNHGIFPTTVGVSPSCPKCGLFGRPNTLFFNDFWFNPSILDAQYGKLADYLEAIPAKSKTLLLELGVGITVPRIRQISNRLYKELAAPLVHVNLEPEPEFLFSGMVTVKAPEIWLQQSTKEALSY